MNWIELNWIEHQKTWQILFKKYIHGKYGKIPQRFFWGFEDIDFQNPYRDSIKYMFFVGIKQKFNLLQNIIRGDFWALEYMFIEYLGTTKYAFTRVGYICNEVSSHKVTY